MSDKTIDILCTCGKLLAKEDSEGNIIFKCRGCRRIHKHKRAETSYIRCFGSYFKNKNGYGGVYMDRSEAREKLEQIRHIESYIRSLEDELKVLNSRTMRITNYSGVPGGGSCDMSDLYSCILVKNDNLLSIIKRKESLVDWFTDITDRLSYDDKSILVDRFVNGYNLEKIARNYYYADRHVVCKVIDRIIKNIS